MTNRAAAVITIFHLLFAQLSPHDGELHAQLFLVPLNLSQVLYERVYFMLFVKQVAITIRAPLSCSAPGGKGKQRFRRDAKG